MYGYGNMISPSNRLFSGAINPLWDGLLAYYTADNTPNDALGTYNGTLVNGATYGTGIINQGFSFDKVNDFIDLGDNFEFDGSTPFSVSLWVKPTTVTGSQTLFSKIASNAPSYPGYQIQLLNNNIRFQIISDFNTGDYLTKKRSLIIVANTWYHVVLTYDGSKDTSGVNLYINGSNGTYNEDVNTLTNNISNNTLKACIGSGNGSYYTGGIIDEVGVWDRELTESEVTELYNSGSGLQY